MKKVLLALAIVFTIASIASAEVLVTANPMGQGQMGWLLGAQYINSSLANSNMYGGGGYFGYGIMDNLDVYGKLAYGTAANPPAGQSMSGPKIGAALKYTVLAEGKDMPVTVAVAGGYQSTTLNWSAFGFSGQQVTGDMGIGVIASKVMVPYVPYGAVNYHSLTVNPGAVTGSQIEIAAGTQFLLSKSSAVVGELCYQTNSGNIGSSTNTQISIAYSAKI